jgi:FkbM family methyltransferase
MYYRLSRFSSTHNLVRKAAYAVLWRLPDGLKYGAGGLWRRYRLPYRLLEPGDPGIQIGAPWDTLRAGRSRAVHFARFVGRGGLVVVVEPVKENVIALKAFAERNAHAEMTILSTGAWSKTTRLRFLVDPDHPASNLVEEVCNDRERDRSAYEVTEIDVDTIDNVAQSLGLKDIKLLSITTNGSEFEILEGAARTLGHIAYVSIITMDADALLRKHGFRLQGHDDRGYTYRRTQLKGCPWGV